MIKNASFLALAACAAPATSSETAALSSFVDNGSFETGDYAGWTLSEDSGQATFGTWGIAADGQTIGPGSTVFDFFDHTLVAEGSPGLPITYHATDGGFVALQLQNGPERHRMFQTVSLPSCQPLLLWDMAYSNHTGFDPTLQYIAVNIRDPLTDAVLATPFQTDAGSPPAVDMTPFVVDLTAFSGQTVRLDFEQQVQLFFFDASYDNIRVLCKGIGAAPGAIDFGAVPVGTTTPPLATSVENFADQPLTLTSIAVAPPFVVVSAPPLPLTLDPGMAAPVLVAFSPTAGGPASGSLVITSDDPNGPTTVALAGTGTQPVVTVAPSALDFAQVRVGTSLSKSVRLSNNGDGPAQIDSMFATGLYSAAPAAPFSIPPGSFVDVEVTFSPSFEGAAPGELSILAQGTPLTVDLAGIGVAPHIDVFPQAIDFGVTRVGTTSATQAVTISNTGTDTLFVFQLVATGPFTITGSPGAIAPGDSATVDVAFSPAAMGPATGTLEIDSDAGPVPVQLFGTGVAPVFTVDTASISFGPHRVGIATTRTIRVGNLGTAPLVVASTTTAAPFGVSPGGPVVVLPGATVPLSVTFAPAATGPASRNVTIASDAGDTSIAVDGIGVAPEIAALPASHDFGDVRVGAVSAPATFAIANPGSDVLTVTAVSFPAGFSATAPLPVPVKVSPGAQLAFDAVFAPLAHAQASGSIQIASDAGPASIAVTGRGVAPALVASLDDVAFGAVAIGSTRTLSVQLANPGDAPATIATVSLVGSPELVATGPALPAVVPPGGAATVSIAFTPAGHGLRSARLAVTGDATLSIPVDGTGSGASAQVTPASLELGAANVGTTTAPRTVTVANTGDVDLAIAAVAIAGAEFSSPATMPLAVAPGASTTIAFAMSPSAVGGRSAQATLVTTDPLAPSIRVDLTGTGTSPAIAVSPPSLDFAGINVGRSATKSFAITNTGSGPLTITSIAATDPSMIVDPVALPLVLSPSASTSLRVTFAPTALGTVSAAVTVISDATPAAVPVSATGTSPTIDVTPSDVDFSSQLVGHPSALRQVHVANTGSGPLAVTSFAIDNPAFALVSPPPLPAAIPAGGELVLSLRVTPAVTGAIAGELAIATDVSPVSVSLAALGVASGLVASPTTIDFGSTHVPAGDAPVTVTLSNLTADTIQLVDAARGGARPGDFAVSTVAGTLVPGASTTATIRYAPATAGLSAATVTFAATDATIPQALVTVAGKAVSTFLTADRDTLSFGTIELGDRSGAKTVTLTNVTTAPVIIASATAGDPQFVVDGVPADPIAPGASASFTVTFVPAAIAPAASTVAISLAGATSPELAVAVTGDGAARTDTGCSAGASTSPWLALAIACVLRRRRR